MVVIKIVGTVGLVPKQFTDHIDQYVQDYVPENSNFPYGLVTTFIKKYAKEFTNAGEAFAYWQQSHGIRTDGRPNRPLTIFHIEIENDVHRSITLEIDANNP